MKSRFIPVLVLFLLSTLAPTAIAAAPGKGLALVTVGKQVIEGVLVRHGGGLRLLVDAGTHGEVAYVVRAADDDAGVRESLEKLAVERLPVPLVPKKKPQMQGGLVVLVPDETPLYAAKHLREYEGIMTEEAEFHVLRIVAKDLEAHVDKVLPMAVSACKRVVRQTEKAELDMALTLLEKTGVLEKMLREVAPFFKEPTGR